MQPTLKSYVIGFVASIVLTLSAYLLVAGHIAGKHQHLTHSFLLAAIASLALVQLVVQLISFLHIGEEGRPGYNLLLLCSTVIIVATIVVGSLWIMDHLDYHLMPPSQMKTYLHDHEGI